MDAEPNRSLKSCSKAYVYEYDLFKNGEKYKKYT